MADTANSAPSSAFFLLDERIQKWIWQSGWTELRDAQEQAIAPILAGNKDVVIAAATAAGKTEAAFLPILTSLLRDDGPSCAIYVSPLKALINDQWGRLEGLCESLEVPVVPWHGDITDSRKKRFLKKPEGVLLITPESLEALLMNRGHGLAGLFSGLRYVVVDEMHAFIGMERGRQLQSLLHRLEFVLKRNVPRIGLSATLGDMTLAAEYLRPGKKGEVELIISKDGSHELKALVKGYVDFPPKLSDKDIQAKSENGETVELEEILPPAKVAVAEHLFKTLRASNNLVFPNSRAHVELYADLLRRMCERNSLPNEFWPHHGSLSKDLREEAEMALKNKERPASAICTTTLELGIDIGAVKSIAQIGPAPSVASLRQRLGRSGRRKGEAAILRCYCIEPELNPDSPISDLLHEGLVQAIAQVRLLAKGWFEPPMVSGLHLSTLIQQLLSAISQYGGLTAGQAWKLLCEAGPFNGLSKAEFGLLLKGLGEQDILIQDSSGLLLYGQLGEKLANHYTFYAAFVTEEEFRLVTEGKSLGSLPISRPLEVESHVIFGGRRWKVRNVDLSAKVIEVIPDKGGKPPEFDGMGGKVHDRVRDEMRQILMESSSVPFLDKTATSLLAEARGNFMQLRLDSQTVIPAGGGVRLFPWKGDWVTDTLTLALRHRGYKVENEGLCLNLRNVDAASVYDTLFDLSEEAFPSETELAGEILNKVQEKWDWLLPGGLLSRNFASHNLDIPGAKKYFHELVSQGVFNSYE
jgi:ATP-dependent Lhr-like helicase